MKKSYTATHHRNALIQECVLQIFLIEDRTIPEKLIRYYRKTIFSWKSFSLAVLLCETDRMNSFLAVTEICTNMI